jgi:hypothetical protein
VKLIQGSMKRSTRSKTPRGLEWEGWAYHPALHLYPIPRLQFPPVAKFRDSLDGPAVKRLRKMPSNKK